MVNRRRFIPTDFEYDFERDELASHRINYEEAVECFFNEFEAHRNKPREHRDRYGLIGRTDGAAG